MKTGLISLALGFVLLWLGWNHWRYRQQETISVLESTVLKLMDEAPLPRTKVDWFLKYFQAILGFTLGLFFAFLGVAIILGEMEMI